MSTLVPSHQPANNSGGNSPKTDPQKLAIMQGWLVYEVGGHTCGGYGPESGYMHEPGCGYEPIMPVEELDALLAEHTKRQAAAFPVQDGSVW